MAVVSAKRSNGWRKAAVSSPSFHEQFETTKLSRRRPSTWATARSAGAREGLRNPEGCRQGPRYASTQLPNKRRVGRRCALRAQSCLSMGKDKPPPPPTDRRGCPSRRTAKNGRGPWLVGGDSASHDSPACVDLATEPRTSKFLPEQVTPGAIHPGPTLSYHST